MEILDLKFCGITPIYKGGKNLPIGIISKGIGGFYYIKTEEVLYECRARGIFRNDEIVPLPGDKVIISILDEKNKIGNIEKILERDSVLVRPAVANVNQIVIVVSVNSPKIDYYLLDKLLITAGLKNIKPVICINKIDLDNLNEHKKFIVGYAKAGYQVIAADSKTCTGYEQLEEVLKDKITVLAGQSGVGKSTMLNNIVNEMVMKTGNMSEKIGRGKHTTRHAELIALRDGGYILDTPGFSSFLLADVKYSELEKYYPDFFQMIGSCKFNQCSHISEPDCSIKNALENGDIDQGRYERYVTIYKDLEVENNSIWRRKKHPRR